MSDRFLIVHPGNPDEGTLVILSDHSFWSQHEPELVEWCLEHRAWHQGMTVTINKESTVTLFCLRWG
jgi:hypothetical protein